jgi:uncharacterized ubiquitin-like protein YukD
MKIVIDVPDYSPTKGFIFNWESGFEVEHKIRDSVAIIKVNKAGLISLANHLLNLAQDDFPKGYHFHLDDYGCFEEGSNELIIEKN